MTDVEFINRWLMDQEKKLNGEPIYRLVWSDDQTEIRSGTFNDFSPSGLYLRTVTETRECPKYSYIRERWVLEKWVPPEQSATHEIPSSMFGTYEPLYVFENSAGEYLAPNRRVVEFIINVKRRQLDHMSPSDRAEFFEMQDQKAFQETYDSLGNTSDIQSLLHSKEAITVPPNYKTDSPEGEGEENAN